MTLTCMPEFIGAILTFKKFLYDDVALFPSVI